MPSVTSQYQTQRFRFQPLTDDDRDLFCELYCNDVVMGKIMPKLERKQASSLFSNILNKQQKSLNVYWRIECVHSEKAVGIQGFMSNIEQQKRNDAEFGILIRPDFYGNHVATESVTAMLFHGFTYLNLATAHAFFDADNIAIQKIAEKLNFEITSDNQQTNKMRCCISQKTFLSHNGQAIYA